MIDIIDDTDNIAHLYSVTIDRHNHRLQGHSHSTYYKYLTQAAWSLDADIR